MIVAKSHDKSTDSVKNGKVVYTCRKRKCQIPCICKECCESGGSQCKLHKIRHEALFNYEEDSMTIRSSEILFKDSSFMSIMHTLFGIPTFQSAAILVQEIFNITTCTTSSIMSPVSFVFRFYTN